MNTILIVDDDTLFLNSLTTVLMSEGYRIVQKSNGMDAMTSIDEVQPDVLIVDYNMPGMSGVQLAQRVYDVKPNILVILITAFGTFDMAVEALEHRVFSVLQKPVEMDRLLTVVHEAFARLEETGEHVRLKHDNLKLQIQKADLAFQSHQFQTVFESIEDAVVFLNDQLQVIGANQAALREADNHLESNPHCSRFFTCGNEAYCTDCPAQRVLQSGVSVSEKFYDEEKHRIYHITAYPVFSEAGHVRSVVEYRRDITAISSLEEKLLKLEQQSERINLAAEVGHEVRNYLMIISGYASIISSNLQKNSVEKIPGNLKALKAGIQRMVDYTDALMRKSTGNYSRTAIDANAFVRSYVEFIRPHKAFASIHFDIRHSGENFIVSINETHFHQILTNLLKNAAEAHAQGTIYISIMPDEDANFVRVMIRDEGPGIPEKIKSRLFQESITTKEEGHGYGLMVVNKLVEANDGRIEVSSKPGNGTTFSLLFQLENSQQAVHA